MSSSDSVFHVLPAALQREIDDAFTTIAKSTPAAASTAEHPNQITTNATSLGGGFLTDDHVVSGGGGFLVDSPSPPGDGGFLIEADHASQPTQIPFSLIPAALQLLDLPPDDPEVLSVFRNAAGGWRASKPSEEDEGEWVSRDDWRAVCAVLVEGADEEEAPMEGDEDVEMSDVYDEPEDVSSADTSDDDYQHSPRPKPSRRTRRAVVAPTSPTPAGQPTPRQRQTALEAFSLFFPDLGEDSNLGKQRIRVGDIQRAANVLREKIKAEEMVEMLDMFSTAPDKSMDLEDFTRMMIAAKLA